MRLFSVLTFALASTAMSACLPVNGDRVLGMHLGMIDPAFAKLPAALTVGFIPRPGVPLVLAAPDVARIAHSHDLDIESASEMCFEIPMRRLGAEDVSRAMLSVLPVGARLEILELPKEDSPSGEITFPAASLEPGTGDRIWRGYVQYGPTRRTPVWARVRITMRVEALVLTSDIARGSAIGAVAVRLQDVSGLPLQARVVRRPEELIGAVARVAMKTGETIPLTALEHPPTVRRGDPVRVDVRSGTTHLLLDAVAQKEGRDGEVIELLNPQSGKTFRARLEGSVAVLIVGGRL